MKQNYQSIFVVAAFGSFLVATGARASVNGDTISIHFGANEPSPSGSELSADMVAGIPEVASANWNNARSEVGEINGLVRDTLGKATGTDASVVWFTTNTWCNRGCGGEFNNNFKGNNLILMVGYLDQNSLDVTIRVRISNLPDDLAASYDVYIYVLGGVPDRGGEYTVNGVTKSHTTGGDGYNGPDFVEDPGKDHSTRGNYLLFSNLSGSTVDISALNTFGGTPRAPINNVQIVKRSK